MLWALAIIGVVATVELFFHVPVLACAKDIHHLMQKSMRTLLSKRISDHWKEEALLAYAIGLMKSSLLVFAYVLVTCIPMSALMSWQPAIIDLLIQPLGIVLSTAAAITYAVIRTYITILL